MFGRIVGEIARREGPRILAGLIGRLGGDFALAQEALQDAYERALGTWPRDGLPRNPSAWLTAVAQRRAIDLIRHSRRHVEDAEAILAQLEAPIADDNGGGHLPDDRLRLLFTCCHPALSVPAQLALALRALCGLSTREIARAFLEPEATTAQRLVRAQGKISAARIPYEVPGPEALADRLSAVLATVYLLYNEGYSSTRDGALVRVDLCTEAIRLGRLIVELMPGEPEALGLLALELLHDARRPGRLAPDGSMVPLDEQDRASWDREKIAEGLAFLDRAIAMRRRGPYQVQAAIAALHAKAPAAKDTDWRQIAALYGALHQLMPNDVVALNAAAAVGMSCGPDAGLAWIDRVESRGLLGEYHLLHAARADLLRRAGRPDEAAPHYRRAIGLATNPAERLYLERRLREVGS